ncbi:MAG TPA: ABC transporter permease [Afifellaceae bacterium]|nr:ABC transporter permease [Afifellaceae bacterium]
MTRLQWMLALLSLAATGIALVPGLGGSAVAPPELLWFAVLASASYLAFAVRQEGHAIIWTSLLLSSLGAAAVISALGDVAARGIGFWSLLVGSWLAAWLSVERLSALPDGVDAAGRLRRIAVPLLFGIWLLILWEAIVRATNVPTVLLPPPSMIWERLTGSLPILWVDFRQTFLKAVIAGYVIGCLSGFVVAVLVDRVGFLKRGLMPIGNLMSALPIIGIAPIMVMWFGFDWQSKAAVVVVMTFFPMLVNSVAGLSAAGHMERDLMRTFAAGYWSSLIKLRIPAALPFIFNALKINSTLALIGAIVAEFFGTPIYGMGFRISTEVGRMNIDMVWAEIAVAALAGSTFYGLVSLIERAFTFWHPSYRSG